MQEYNWLAIMVPALYLIHTRDYVLRWRSTIFLQCLIDPNPIWSKKMNYTLIQMNSYYTGSYYLNWDSFFIIQHFTYPLYTHVQESTGKTPVELSLGIPFITHFQRLDMVSFSENKFVGHDMDKQFTESQDQINKTHKRQVCTTTFSIKSWK